MFGRGYFFFAVLALAVVAADPGAPDSVVDLGAAEAPRETTIASLEEREATLAREKAAFEQEKAVFEKEKAAWQQHKSTSHPVALGEGAMVGEALNSHDDERNLKGFGGFGGGVSTQGSFAMSGGGAWEEERTLGDSSSSGHDAHWGGRRRRYRRRRWTSSISAVFSRRRTAKKPAKKNNCHPDCKDCIPAPAKYRGKPTCVQGKNVPNCIHESWTKSRCTSCRDPNKFVAAHMFKMVGGKKVASGECMAPPKLNNYNPTASDIDCTFSQCYDAEHGWQLGYKGNTYLSAKKIACSRICLIGGRLTKLKGLMQKKGGAKTEIDKKFAHWNGYSSPVCTFHKTALCEKTANFDAAKCAKGNAKYCENCHVAKKLNCHAILPTYMSPGSKRMSDNQLAPYKDACKYALDPCATAARYL